MSKLLKAKIEDADRTELEDYITDEFISKVRDEFIRAIHEVVKAANLVAAKVGNEMDDGSAGTKIVVVNKHVVDYVIGEETARQSKDVLKIVQCEADKMRRKMVSDREPPCLQDMEVLPVIESHENTYAMYSGSQSDSLTKVPRELSPPIELFCKILRDNTLRDAMLRYPDVYDSTSTVEYGTLVEVAPDWSKISKKERTRYCTQCLKRNTNGGKYLACSGCRKARYCSKECQVAHWETHKITCK